MAKVKRKIKRSSSEESALPEATPEQLEKEAEQSKQFMYVVAAIFGLIVVGFIVLQVAG